MPNQEDHRIRARAITEQRKEIPPIEVIVIGSSIDPHQGHLLVGMPFYRRHHQGHHSEGSPGISAMVETHHGNFRNPAIPHELQRRRHGRSDMKEIMRIHTGHLRSLAMIEMLTAGRAVRNKIGKCPFGFSKTPLIFREEEMNHELRSNLCATYNSRRDCPDQKPIDKRQTVHQGSRISCNNLQNLLRHEIRIGAVWILRHPLDKVP